ncbi:MAG: hypothetical protein P1U46_02115 [Patescibacteria group bacterium]|nr:hypothetical protein [Patescibacteria group bacterium]
MIPKWYDEYKKYIDGSISIYLNSFLDKESNIYLDTFKESVLYASN